MGRYVSLWVAMGRCGSLCVAMGRYVSLCVAMGRYVSLWSLWVAMGPYGRYGSLWVPQTFGLRALPALHWIFPLAVTLSTFGGVNGSLFTCSRLFYAGARRGHLPALLAMIHVHRKTPVPALLLTCAMTLLMLVTGELYTLINYVGIVNHLWYGVTVMALLQLRRARPQLPRPIRVPLWVPLLFVLQWLLLLLFSLWAEPWLCLMAAAVTACGVPLYFLGVAGPSACRPCSASWPG
ncbi:large neutral amino acids transporter small subunit 2-like [Lagopus muta]|uniref:large neutral amino acids transporter small subunit 2-like n=1 Tax=Lagopus muta TaxID=64668 RepID=UPI00209EC619|nr:large neutral amino acids transporter small subunit 2-like [Lagopus muta]